MFYQFNHLGSPDYMKLEKNQNFSFPLHLHQCFEFIVILSGEMKITVDRSVYRLKEKEALLIFPNQIHSLESEKSEHMLCIFSPRLVQAYATKVTDQIPLNHLFLPDDYLVNALAGLETHSSTASKKGVLYSLCGQFDRNAVYKTHPSDEKDLLFRIFSFVESEFRSDCSLLKLSAELGYDYAYLSRCFKKITGISYNTYVNHYRLSHACYLLENSTAPIIQCAFDSGYTSLRSFNRNFKTYFQITPVQYRQKTKGL